MTMNSTSTRRFSGKRVLVTGTAQGIGRRVAERFVGEGAEVIGLGRKPVHEKPVIPPLPLLHLPAPLP